MVIVVSFTSHDHDLHLPCRARRTYVGVRTWGPLPSTYHEAEGAPKSTKNKLNRGCYTSKTLLYRLSGGCAATEVDGVGRTHTETGDSLGV